MNRNLSYEKIGRGISIVLLHGWGGSKESLRELAVILRSKGFACWLIDLPGFGKSFTPPETWGLKEYAQVVTSFMQKNSLENAFIFGHSFGGSVAIELAAKQNIPIKGLILCASAGIRPKLSPKRILLFLPAKIGKLILLPLGLGDIGRGVLYKLIRERDYVKASPTMKKVMQKILHEDVRSLLPSVKLPVLLLWGREDVTVPISHAYLMHDVLENSKLKILSGYRHNLPLVAPELAAQEITNFAETL